MSSPSGSGTIVLSCLALKRDALAFFGSAVSEATVDPSGTHSRTVSYLCGHKDLHLVLFSTVGARVPGGTGGPSGTRNRTNLCAASSM